MTTSEKRKKEIKQFILDKREEGKVVVMGLEGPMSMPLDSIIQQPVDGLLYDLNRLEETALTFIDDPKWVNDFAVALVIRKLKSKLTQLEADWIHMKEWASQPPAGLTEKQIMDAVVRMCDDALGGDDDPGSGA